MDHSLGSLHKSFGLPSKVERKKSFEPAVKRRKPVSFFDSNRTVIPYVETTSPKMQQATSQEQMQELSNINIDTSDKKG